MGAPHIEPESEPEKKNRNQDSRNEKSGDLFGPKEGATRGAEGQGPGQTTTSSPSPSAAVPHTEASPRGESPTPPSSGGPPRLRENATVATPAGEAGGCAKPKRHSKPKPAQDAASFEAFWHAYPNKEGIGGARKAFAKALKKATLEEILDGVRRYKEIDKVKRGFILNPAKWLNDEHWSDEPAPAAVIDQNGRPDMPYRANGQRMSAGTASTERKRQILREAGMLS